MGRVLIRGGTVFDGRGGEGRRADVQIDDGRVTAIGEVSAAPGAEEIDASGGWVTPGFIDLHTHYDAELELAPALGESVRHGVTTALIGSCGLGMAVGRPSDLADMFCRVEGIPRETVAPLFERIKDWDTPTDYLAHLKGLSIGPNVTAMLGHSTIRAHVMGLGRSLSHDERPSRDELARMTGLLEEALDQGYLGLSINTLPWDKMDGDDYRSRPTPSVFGTWGEYRALTRVLRRRGRVFQGVPNISTKLNVLLFCLESIGLVRPTLKTAMISMVDAKADRLACPLVGHLTRVLNRWFGADIRFQSLPNPFDMWVDGLEVPVMEEFGAGTEALHVRDPAERSALLRDPDFRRRFKKHWRNRLVGRAYHRDFDEPRIVACPDASVVGKTFGEIARAEGKEPEDAFLDLAAAHGNALRWYTVLGNDRPDMLRWIVDHPSVLIGFSDAGAHLRNMGFYNFPLQLLRMVRDAEREGRPLMSTGRAVWRLTREIADWLDIEAGVIAPGAAADLVVVDPEGLDDSLDTLVEAEMPELGGLRRIVRRNDRAVRAVLINGRPAWQDSAFAEGLGAEPGYGRVIPARGAPGSGDR